MKMKMKIMLPDAGDCKCNVIMSGSCFFLTHSTSAAGKLENDSPRNQPLAIIMGRACVL